MALLWGGLSLSAIGDQLYAVALTWIAVGVLGSAAGYLSALQAGIVLLALLGIGRWADGWDERRSLVGADLCRAAILLAVVLAWEVSGGPSGAGLVAAIAVLAVGQAVFRPALQTVLPALVEDTALLPATNGLLDATDRSARLVGPGLVALMAGTVPVVHFLTLDAASFLASAAAVLAIRLPGGTWPSRQRGTGSLGSIRDGARALRRHPVLGYVLATGGLLNGAWYAVFYLGVPLLIQQRHLTGWGGGGLGAFGLVISAYGCTNLAATLVFGGRALPERPQIQMFGGTLLSGVGIVLVAAAGLLPDAWLLPGTMAAAAVCAVGGPMKDIPFAVLMQTRLARTEIAAAMRAYMAAVSLGTLASLLLAPPLLGRFGTGAVMAACGAVIMAIGAGGLARRMDGAVTPPGAARRVE